MAMNSTKIILLMLSCSVILLEINLVEAQQYTDTIKLDPILDKIKLEDTMTLSTTKISDDKTSQVLPVNMVIDSFDDCVAAGNLILESYPAQCNTKDGLHFVEKVGLCVNVSDDNPIYMEIETEDAGNDTKIKVEGCVSEITDFKKVNIKVFDPDEKLVTSGSVVLGIGGGFVKIFEQQFLTNGTYSVAVDVNDEFFATETFVVPEFGIIVFGILVVGLIAAIVLPTKVLPKRMQI